MFYCWYFAACAGFANARVMLMAGVVTVWGARLTFNFAIKGGYSGGEDYRWKETRVWFPGWRYVCFVFSSFFFFSIFCRGRAALPRTQVCASTRDEWCVARSSSSSSPPSLGGRFELFALVFVNLFQLTEILAFTTPVVAAYYAVRRRDARRVLRQSARSTFSINRYVVAIATRHPTLAGVRRSPPSPHPHERSRVAYRA